MRTCSWPGCSAVLPSSRGGRFAYCEACNPKAKQARAEKAQARRAQPGFYKQQWREQRDQATVDRMRERGWVPVEDQGPLAGKVDLLIEAIKAHHAACAARHADIDDVADANRALWALVIPNLPEVDE